MLSVYAMIPIRQLNSNATPLDRSGGLPCITDYNVKLFALEILLENLSAS